MGFSLSKQNFSLQTAFQQNILLFPLTLFVFWRVLTAVVALASVNMIEVQTPVFDDAAGRVYNQALPPDSPLAWLVEPWHRFDTGWYIKNAITGYQADYGIVFPPFYPVLIRLVATFCAGNYVLAALIVSNTACAIALILLYRLVIREFGDHQLAQRTLILLVAFPTAFFMLSGYAEPLFLALTLGAWLATLDRRWLLAGVLAALAALTRIQGAVLMFPLAWIAYIRLRETGWRAQLVRLPVLIGGPAGLLAHMLYLRVNNLGDMNSMYNAGWGSNIGFPGQSIILYLNRFLSGETLGYENTNFVLLIIFMALSVVVLLRFRPEYGLYLWATLGLLLLRNFDTSQFKSTFRHFLMFFPCFILIGMILKHPRWTLVYMIIGFCWQMLLIALYTHWSWVA